MAHTRLNPLLRWARARQRELDQPDFGDHGTAFGMELSMTPAAPSAAAPAHPPPSSTGGADPASPPGAGVVQPPPGEMLGRWRRLGGRRPWRDG